MPATVAPPARSSSPAGSVTLPSAEELRGLRTGLDAFLSGWLQDQRGVAGADAHPTFTTLYDDLREFACRPGKRLRPLLFLLAHRIFVEVGRGKSEVGSLGKQVTDSGSTSHFPLPTSHFLLPIAASLELLHAFILIHDDIIDRSELRRALPTLHRVIEHRLTPFSDRRRAGRNLALVMGDILFALAQRCLLEAPGIDPALRLRLASLLLGCMVETGFGEVADIIHGTRDVSRVSVLEIEQMYRLKTTLYTVECPLAMAALLAGVGDAETLAALGRVARPAGLAFQIQNDLQEFARFEVSDAEIPSDVLEGKKTLLARTAFDRLNESDQGMLQLCLDHGEPPSEAKVGKARDLVAKSGAIGQLSDRMESLFAEADTAARVETFPEPVRAGLAGLIRMMRGATGGASHA